MIYVLLVCVIAQGIANLLLGFNVVHLQEENKRLKDRVNNRF